MKLLGRDITAEKLMAKVEARLRARGLLDEKAAPIQLHGVEPRVDPLSFNLRALEENADPTVGLPLHTHRDGLGQSVLWVKWAFRKATQVFINEVFGRQRVFNGHVRDSYAQLSAEVLRLREELAELKGEASRSASSRTSAAGGNSSAAPSPRSRKTKKKSSPRD